MIAPPRYPGVFLEAPRFSRPITNGVPVGVAGFVGLAKQRGKKQDWPLVIGSYQEFVERLEAPAWGYLADSVRGFFENGGDRCYISGVDPRELLTPDLLLGINVPGARSGLYALDEIRDVELLAAPDLMAVRPGESLDLDLVAAGQQQLLAFATGGGAGLALSQGGYFCILDAPPASSLQEVSVHRKKVAPPGPDASYGAMFYPWVQVETPKGLKLVPPSGHLMGGFNKASRAPSSFPPGTITTEAGPQHSPANTSLMGVSGVPVELTRAESGSYLDAGVNILLPWPARGIVVWGARSMSTEQPQNQISVRRVLNYVERSVREGTQWAVFEPNDEKLWKKLRGEIETFLEDLYNKGLVVGATAGDAFVVKCDIESNPADVRDRGQLVAEVWVRPVRPVEMIMVRIIHRTAAGE